MGPAARGTSVRFRVLIDGQPPGAAHGIDIDDQGNGTVTEQRLYQLIRQPKPIADRQVEIEFCTSDVLSLSKTMRQVEIRVSPRSPSLNAFAEGFVRSIKEQCLDRMPIAERPGRLSPNR